MGGRFSTEVEILIIRFLKNNTLLLLVNLSRKKYTQLLNLILFFNVDINLLVVVLLNLLLHVLQWGT